MTLSLRSNLLSCCLGLGFLFYSGILSWAHEGHQAATYQVTPAATNLEQSNHIRLRIIDADSGKPIAARFSLMLDGEHYVPSELNSHGLRFLSIHQRKNHQFVATYSRGSGDVLVPIPTNSKSGVLTVAKGFEFLTVTQRFDLTQAGMVIEVRLSRWVNLRETGWHAADEHLHYERTEPKHDADWMTMLDGDGLSHAHFLMLKGGNLPGIWADQFAYGREGEADDGSRLIRPGEEYRDSTQGHINLLGIQKVIPPISTGGLGQPKVSFNYPPLRDVFQKAHDLGGIGGPAHGASLARSSTAILDTVLGQVDFFEIANTHLYKTDVWYQLLNCGFVVPPMAGTDLPNFGFRDSWQPLLGEIRTYVRCGDRHDFESWKAAVRRGEVFVTSGPLLKFEVNGKGPGGIIHLPQEGGQITVSAELTSPRPLEIMEVVKMGQPLEFEVKKSHDKNIFRLSVNENLVITKSCWLAARGLGGPKTAVEKGLNIKQNEIAHTGIVQVIVGDTPIRSKPDVAKLHKHLAEQREYYRTQGNYEKAEHRLRFVNLFDQAIDQLKD